MSFLRTSLPRLTPLISSRPSSRLLSNSVIRLSNPPSKSNDPFPLPFSSPDLAQNNRLSDDAEEWALPPPLDRTGEDANTLRSRLIYQTRKRGTLETDLILSTFAKEFLPTMSVDEMKEFDKLLDEPDWDIFYWSVQKREPPPRWKDTSLLKKLIQHAKNEGKVVRMMPALMQKEPEL
ncbi:hypothetical protein I302_103281 [Kwoniella bestiolae CBS 10118]|uniref:Succinate dehydrogenase assembly factor 2, mitochondrial n=1 Tax=Kwoniella bestiolae CBS 10118 TaxID=1296100 RepID=A0A1B9G7Y3_9TREE|nr:succinate dehydrogenase assembly factor 2, mitochondrial [Kwoniella bestiolae CBS 10118]OCF27145.1 succinate dehydrogenase assembly factor 2, mitochondrial [Kwoniella bestiolae CBS 10118]